MIPFHSHMCPLCCGNLVRSHTPGYYVYDCNDCGRYMYSERVSGEPVKSEVHLKGYYLMYIYHKTNPRTSVFRFRDQDKNYGPYQFLFDFKGYFPLNWNVPDQSVQRLKNLLVFS